MSARRLDRSWTRRSPICELIVIDDGSTDATVEIAAACAARDPRVRLLQQAERRHLQRAEPRPPRRAGAFIAILDSDDLWAPDFLAAQMRILEERPEIDIVTGNAWFLRAAGARAHRRSPRASGAAGARSSSSSGPRPDPRRRDRRLHHVGLPVPRVRDDRRVRRDAAHQRGLRLLAPRRGRRVPVPPQRRAARPLPQARRQPVGERAADGARHPASSTRSCARSCSTVRRRSRSSTRRWRGSKASAWPPRRGGPSRPATSTQPAIISPRSTIGAAATVLGVARLMARWAPGLLSKAYGMRRARLHRAG